MFYLCFWPTLCIAWVNVFFTIIFRHLFQTFISSPTAELRNLCNIIICNLTPLDLLSSEIFLLYCFILLITCCLVDLNFALYQLLGAKRIVLKHCLGIRLGTLPKYNPLCYVFIDMKARDVTRVTDIGEWPFVVISS